MTFVTQDVKKTCDSQRMGEREAVAEIRALIQPVVSWRMSGGPRGLDAGRENTPTFLSSLEDLHVLCLGFLRPTPASQGGKNV